MNQDFFNTLLEEHKQCSECPSNQSIQEFFEALLSILFPIFGDNKINSSSELKMAIEKAKLQLTAINANKEWSYDQKMEATAKFFAQVPKIYKLLCKDIDAMYEGDPAAKSKDEVMRTYPGFYAIAAYRIAHELELLQLDILPRSITENAHHRTGIDIHPGATIGEYFCIDHGTGVVIGETTVIGDHVKLYQGVTLGALSVNKADASKKRHPTIGDRVVVYAGATILGGETYVGEGSVIGGNVWLPKSVPPGSKVYYKAQMHHQSKESGVGENADTYVFSS